MDIRRLIKRELRRQKKSSYWLAQKAVADGAAHQETIYRYLRGKRDTTGEIIGYILDTLGVKLVGVESPKELAGSGAGGNNSANA